MFVRMAAALTCPVLVDGLGDSVVADAFGFAALVGVVHPPPVVGVPGHGGYLGEGRE